MKTLYSENVIKLIIVKIAQVKLVVVKIYNKNY